jgi:5-methylcytosine-specific restriction endonuclease McrBC regulatory subunit McrC
MRISIPTNHNFYEEKRLSECELLAKFGPQNQKKTKNKTKKHINEIKQLFSSVLLLTTKNQSFEKIKLFGFKHQRKKLNEEEQLLLKMYKRERENGELDYFIQTGLFAGVIYYKGYEVNITSRYGDVFLRRMLNYVNDIYVDNQQIVATRSNEPNEFQNIIAYLFIQSLEKSSMLGLPQIYKNTSQHDYKVRGKIDITAYLKKSVPFTGKITSSLREQAYVQEIVDVLYLACTLLTVNFGRELNQKVMGTLQLLRQNYSGRRPNSETIMKAKTHVSLTNPAFSSFKKVLEYAELIIKQESLSPSKIASSMQTQGYLFDISQLFELYLEKLLSRYFNDWYVTGQEELTVYSQHFFKRSMYPDLVLKHKETGRIIVFDAKYKKMEFVSTDLDRADFYQIHSYIQYYGPKALFGGLLYPLSKDNYSAGNASNIFDNHLNNTGFIVDGIFVEAGMSEEVIAHNEKKFLARLNGLVAKANF